MKVTVAFDVIITVVAIRDPYSSSAHWWTGQPSVLRRQRKCAPDSCWDEHCKLTPAASSRTLLENTKVSLTLAWLLGHSLTRSKSSTPKPPLCFHRTYTHTQIHLTEVDAQAFLALAVLCWVNDLPWGPFFVQTLQKTSQAPTAHERNPLHMMQPMYTNHQKCSTMVYTNTSFKDTLRQAWNSHGPCWYRLVRISVSGNVHFLNPFAKKICSDLSTDILTS